ncbi:uncharacterized protein ACIBXB_018834 [Morphnus guianensis]
MDGLYEQAPDVAHDPGGVAWEESGAMLGCWGKRQSSSKPNTPVQRPTLHRTLQCDSERKLSARRMTPGQETPSRKTTYGTATRRLYGSPRGVKTMSPLQDSTVKTEVTDAQEAWCQDQERQDAGKQPQSEKTDSLRAELLTLPRRMPQKRNDRNLPRPIHALELLTQEKKHPIGTMPTSTGVQDPRDGTQRAFRAP